MYWIKLYTLITATLLSVAAKETLENAVSNTRSLVTTRSYGISTFMSTIVDDVDTSLIGQPIGSQEFFSPAPGGSPDLVILAQPISKMIRNALNNPNSQCTIAIKDEQAESKHKSYGAADRNRVILFGHLERLNTTEEKAEAAEIFGRVHPDAKLFFPGKGPHFAFWTRFVIEKIYYIGGFGDKHYIGWIPVEMYANASKIEQERAGKLGRLYMQAGMA